MEFEISDDPRYVADRQDGEIMPSGQPGEPLEQFDRALYIPEQED